MGPSFTAPIIPDFFQPFEIVIFPSSDVRKLYISIIRFVRVGFNRVRLKLISICSMVCLLQFSSSVLMYSRLTNFFRIKYFSEPFMFKSRGWKKCVVFVGTLTTFTLGFFKIAICQCTVL